MNTVKRRLSAGSLLLTGIIFFLMDSTYAGGIKWLITSSAQTTQGKYIYGSNSQTNYLTMGFSCRSERWTVSLNIPFVFQQNGQITRSGDLFTPMGGAHPLDVGSDNRHHHGTSGEILESISSNYEYGLGDVFLYGNIKILGKTNNAAGIFFNTQIKFPLASYEESLGTGEYDYGFSLSVKQTLNTYIFFTDGGFLVIGDPEDISYNDPLTWGAGVGKTFLKGRYSTVLYYQQYSKIIDGYEPPRQISLGINYRVNSSMIISLGGLMGFSETSPDVGLNGSIQWRINK